MANIVIKKADGTTDITYTAVVPSAGDSSPAIWQCQSVGTAAMHYPSLEVKSRWNGQKTARRVDFVYVYPQIATDTTTSLTSVVNRMVLNGSFLVPTAVPTATAAEWAAQGPNLLASALLKSVWNPGYSPT